MDPVIADIIKVALAAVIAWLTSQAQSRTKADKTTVDGKADKSDVRRLREFVRRIFGAVGSHHTRLDAALNQHEQLTRMLPLEHRSPFESWEVHTRFIADGLRGELAAFQLDPVIWEDDMPTATPREPGA